MKRLLLLPFLLLGLTQASADQTLAGAAYSTDAVISPSSPGSDFWLYEEQTPSNLALTNNPANLISVLQGHAGAPGGNIEIFPLSETSTYADMSVTGAFANTTPITLSGTAGTASFTFRSLNGQDWFNTGSAYDTSYGVANLANQWFNGFIDSVISKMSNPGVIAGINASRSSLFDDWRDTGGFNGLSDANIGYVYQEVSSGDLKFGLEGFIDASPRFRQFMADNGYGAFVSFVPDGIQYSEVVILNGVVHYSFEATPSGVQLDDAPYNSYTGTSAFTVQTPEPSGAMLALMTFSLALLRHRRRA